MHQNFYGQHIGKTDPYHLTQFFKGLYGLAIIYPVALSLSKLSLLALYWRIFRVTSARLPMQIAAGLNIAWGIAAVCDPVCLPWSGTLLTVSAVLGRNFQLYTCTGILGFHNRIEMYQLQCLFPLQ